MPAGLVLTLPPPGPAAVTDSGYPNVAATAFRPSVVTEQVGDDPEQAPPQERKTAPGSGVAVSVTIADGTFQCASHRRYPWSANHVESPMLTIHKCGLA